MTGSDIKTAHTPDGLVVRVFHPHREEAYHFGRNGAVSHCSGPKGPWVVVDASGVPERVRAEAKRFWVPADA